MYILISAYIYAYAFIYRCLFVFFSIYAALYIGISFSVYEKGETSAAIMRYGDPTILLPQWGENICFVVISFC